MWVRASNEDVKGSNFIKSQPDEHEQKNEVLISPCRAIEVQIKTRMPVGQVHFGEKLQYGQDRQSFGATLGTVGH